MCDRIDHHKKGGVIEMMKRGVCVFLLICMVVTSVAAAWFPDVPTSHEHYDAITALSEKGIINGYSDGTFKPNGNITRAEAATIIARAAELGKSSKASLYYDVATGSWACGYIMAATDAGIINGFGAGKFSPNGTVTYNQMIKMIVCMIGLEDQALKNGGWPLGYVTTASRHGIIDSSTSTSIRYKGLGNTPIARQKVAAFLYNALAYREKNTLYVGGKALWLGMSASRLGTPDARLDSVGNFVWYIYGTDTYQNFYAVGVDQNKIVALTAAGRGFRYMGYQSGDVVQPNIYLNSNACLYADSNDGYIAHGALILADGYQYDRHVPAAWELAGECKLNFHCVNAFRVYHNLRPLKWSEQAAVSARLHSEDMAQNNYFSHTSLSGTSVGERIYEQGIDWMSCGENIAAGTGHFLGFYAYNGWVNSAGHRKNMLNDYNYLGIGMAYNQNSTYRFYTTQNFFG